MPTMGIGALADGRSGVRSFHDTLQVRWHVNVQRFSRADRALIAGRSRVLSVVRRSEHADALRADPSPEFTESSCRGLPPFIAIPYARTLVHKDWGRELTSAK